MEGIPSRFLDNYGTYLQSCPKIYNLDRSQMKFKCMMVLFIFVSNRKERVVLQDPLTELQRKC